MDSLLGKCPHCGENEGVYVLDICVRQFNHVRATSKTTVNVDWVDEPDRIDDEFEVRCHNCGELRSDIEVTAE